MVMKLFGNNIVVFLTTLLISLALVVVFSAGAQAQIGSGGVSGGVDSAHGSGMPTNLVEGDSSIINNIINIMLYAVGVLSVIMLIFGGIRYVVSGGQKDKVTDAKNTILYAIVGLLIAIFANAIIQFVLGVALGGGFGSTNV